MAVTINKTDGTVLTTIQDGASDTLSTNLTLIGRLYRNYGELVNENFVKLLENFANSSSPTTPIVGQLWYNTSNGAIHVYRSNGFVGLAVLTTSAAQPNSPRISDLWFDTADAQLKLYNGTSWLAVSPSYTLSQAKTGVFAETIRDVINANHVCLVHYQSNSIVAIHSRDVEFIPQTAISGFTSIKPGLNMANVGGQQFVGTASNSANLGNVAANKFLRNDINGIIDGSLTLSNDGLTIGETDDLKLYNEGAISYISKTEGQLDVTVGIDTILRINEDQQLLVTNGAENTPSLSFLSDTNSGIYRIDEDIIGVSVSGNTILEISPDGLFINGTIQANDYTGTLVSDSISVANLSVTANANVFNLNVANNTILGTNTTNSVTIRASNITIPNGLVFSTANVQFNGLVKFGNSITTDDGISPLTVDSSLLVNVDAEINGALVVQQGIDVGGVLVSDTNGRLTLNSSVATGYANLGDFSMGSTNGIRSYNSPKMWVAFGWSSPTLFFYDSFQIDAVTRTTTNNYAITTEYPISSGAMAVVGTNGIQLAAAPSIGATSFAITTTSESTRMAFVVLSQ